MYVIYVNIDIEAAIKLSKGFQTSGLYQVHLHIPKNSKSYEWLTYESVIYFIYVKIDTEATIKLSKGFQTSGMHKVHLHRRTLFILQ